MINTFHKNHLNKFAVRISILNFILPMAKLIVKPTTKKKYNRPVKLAKQTKKL